VNVAHVASAKSALTCASRLNPLPRQLAKVKSLPLQCKPQRHAWLSPSLSLLLQHRLRQPQLLRLPHSLAYACQR
jgi:hypothetical protein